jgi:hypothetical protein
MLTGLLGTRLVLLIGDTIPLPAPLEVTTALVRAEVTIDDTAGDGFQLHFTASKDGIIDYGLLRSGLLAPWKRVIIGVLFGAVPEVLVDGIITQQDLVPSAEPGRSTLTVNGRDVSTMLGLEERNAKYDNQPDFLIVTQAILRYAQYGLVPQVTPTTDVPIMLDRIPRQQETDLALIRRLAQRNGFVFYVEPATFGVNTAYWGPENRLSLPQPALTLGMGPASNLKSLSFGNDAMAPVGTTGTFVEPITKTAIPIPPLPSLKAPPLAVMSAPPRRTTILRDTASQSPGQAALSALSAATSSPDAVTGQGEVDVVRYGRALKARRLVGVRGTGFNYGGNYYVRRVSHTIERGSFATRFSLSREGTGALLPVVLP